jgi:hypothetical protein
VVEAKAEALLGAGDQVKKALAVLVIMENGVAVVAAIHQVVAGSLGPLQAARQAGHGILLLGMPFSCRLGNILHRDCSKASCCGGKELLKTYSI